MLLLCAACATMKPAQQSDSNFYKSSSKKMGVNFSGTEDKALIKASSSWMGVPYRYGGEEKTGVDCSGFVLNVFKEAYGITLPRTSAAMSKQVRRVRKDKLQCGDLLFFTVKDRRVSHVGIYMADNKFVHSSSSYGVSVADLGDAYWSKYFAGAGRVEMEDAQEQKLTVDDSVQRDPYLRLSTPLSRSMDVATLGRLAKTKALRFSIVHEDGTPATGRLIVDSVRFKSTRSPYTRRTAGSTHPPI